MNRTALLDQLQGNQFNQDPVLSELRSKVPDEFILKFVKSRYIQSPSELRNWAAYLERTYSTELADAQAAAVGALTAGYLYIRRREKELDEYESLLFSEDFDEDEAPEADEPAEEPAAE